MKKELEKFLIERNYMFDGTVLRTYRRKKKMSQSDVAKALNTHQQTISRHESTDLLPSSEYLIAYSYLYDVSIDEIVFGRR